MKLKFNKFIYALAPMAGVTDFAFRKICADFGADMVVTEMISLKAFENNSRQTSKMLREEANAICGCQVFFHDPNIAHLVADKQFEKFDFIDLNCGCPAPKIVKNKDGSAMMKDIDNSREVISALVKSTSKPVSVKFRLGIDGNENYLEFAKMCEQCGVAFVTLHARTREQGYAGNVDKDAYKKLINAVNIPVFWSGDIISKQDAEFAKSIGCAGVMIGRSAMGCPEIFCEFKGTNKPYSKKQAIQTHLELLKTYFRTEKTLVAYFKKHLMWYVKNEPLATKKRLEIMQYTNLEEIENLISLLPD